MRALRRRPRDAAPAVAALGGLAVVIGVLLPWYTSNLAEPFTPETTTGWEATRLAQIALALGAVVVLSAATSIVVRRSGVLDPSVEAGLGWIMLVASIGAALLISYRLVWLPPPEEFLSRQAGIYVALAGAVLAAVASVGEIASRDVAAPRRSVTHGDLGDAAADPSAPDPPA